jgi:hypothetical protein
VAVAAGGVATGLVTGSVSAGTLRSQFQDSTKGIRGLTVPSLGLLSGTGFAAVSGVDSADPSAVPDILCPRK